MAGLLEHPLPKKMLCLGAEFKQSGHFKDPPQRHQGHEESRIYTKEQPAIDSWASY
jgi:hypothetical protein